MVTAAVALALVFAYRMVALRSQVALGIDAGNYLATMQQLFGTDVSGEGLRRPPLVGILLWPLAQLFGSLEATKLLAVAASVLIGVPFYLLCSRFTGRAVALAVSLPFMFSVKYMDAVSWGFLTLVSVGLFTLCFYLIHEILVASSLDKRKVLALALASSALIGTGQMYGFIYAATTLALGAVIILVGGRLRRGVPRLLPAALLAVVLSLPYVPVYLHHAEALGSKSYVATVASPLGAGGVSEDGGGLYFAGRLGGAWEYFRSFYVADPALLWVAVALAALAGAVVLFRRSPAESVLPLTLLLAPFALNVLLEGAVSARAAYLVYVPIWLGFAVCADALVRATRGRLRLTAGLSVWALALLVSLAVLATLRGHLWLQDAAEWYGYLGTEHVMAIEAADRGTPPGAGVAYPWGLGYWVEGLAGRPVYDVNEREGGVFLPGGESAEVPIGSIVLAGDRVTSNGAVFVAEAYVVADMPMDPVLGIDSYYLEHLLYLDDRLIEVEYGAGTASRRVTLADASRQESVTETTGDAFVDRRTYELEGLRVVKEVTLPKNGERVTVVLRVESESSTVHRVTVPVQPALPTIATPTGPQETLYAFKGSWPFGSGWWASASVQHLSAQGDKATFTLIEDRAAAVAEVRPESSRAEVTLAFVFRGQPFRGRVGIRSYAAEDVIRDHGVTFAVVDRYPAKPWYGDTLDVTTLAWLESAPYFQPLWEGESVAAYLVGPDAPREASAQP